MPFSSDTIWGRYAPRIAAENHTYSRQRYCVDCENVSLRTYRPPLMPSKLPLRNCVPRNDKKN